RVAVVVDPHRALQPPVRRVQGVRVVRAGDVEAGAAHASGELAGAVDADVAAGLAVVLVGQGPADALGQVRGHGHGDRAARPEDPDELGQRRGVGRDVLHHLGRDHPVEAGVGEREGERVAPGGGAAGGRRALAGLFHGGDDRQGVEQLVLVAVEGDDARAATQGLEGVAAAAAAEVEQTVTGTQTEAVVVDGEHQPRPSARLEEIAVEIRPLFPRDAVSSIARRYCSTVCRAISVQVKRSRTWARPAVPSRSRSAASSRTRPMAPANAPGSPGGTVSAFTPSGPTTSGRAPPVVATRGAPQAMASMAGSEKPSYSEGTTATDASLYSSTMRSWLTPLMNVTAPSSPRRSMRLGMLLPSRGLPMITSSASRSVGTLATASRSGTSPLRATSALAVVMMRPGTRSTWGSGRKWSVSTPTGTIDMRS